MIEGQLSSAELMVAAMVGVLRGVRALYLKRPAAHGAPNELAWDMNITGAAAEMAVARWLDRYWYTLDNGSLRELPGDVGVGIQVRSTARRNGCLILHPNDDATALWYLVVTDLPRFWIVGRIVGADGMQDRFWRTDVRDPAFFVPQSVLQPVHEGVRS